jgi:hypothetical protein
MNFTDISTYWPIIMVFFFANGKSLITIKSIRIGCFHKQLISKESNG